MVCSQCRDAAAFLGEEEVIYQYLDGRPQEMMPGWEVALLFHAKCREAKRRAQGDMSPVEKAGSSWCDCQHVVPGRTRAEAPTLSR